MHFVYGDGRVKCLPLRPVGEPLGVVPLVVVDVGHHGGGIGAVFGVEAVGVGLFGTSNC